MLPPERRNDADRRSLSWRTFIHGSITPRRRGHRRIGEHESLVRSTSPVTIARVPGRSDPSRVRRVRSSYRSGSMNNKSSTQ
jgi:hypothetical protein